MDITQDEEEQMKLHLNVLSELLEEHGKLSELQKTLLNLYMDLPIEKTKTIDLLQSPVIMEISSMRKMIRIAGIVKQFIKYKAEMD